MVCRVGLYGRCLGDSVADKGHTVPHAAPLHTIPQMAFPRPYGRNHARKGLLNLHNFRPGRWLE